MKTINNQDLQKMNMKLRTTHQAKSDKPTQEQFPSGTQEQPVVALQEMNCIQKLTIMHKLVTDLRDYIEYMEMAQSDKSPVLDMNAVAVKAGMSSRKELNAFLNELAASL